MPSQDSQPSTTQFAYPAYWAANFTTCVCFACGACRFRTDAPLRSCAWSEKPCLDPLLQTQQCLFFTVCRQALPRAPRALMPRRSAPRLLWLAHRLVRTHAATLTLLGAEHNAFRLQKCRLARAMTAFRTCATLMQAVSDRTRCARACDAHCAQRGCHSSLRRAPQHHCNPLIIPSNTSMQFYCVVEPQDGVFLCYFRRALSRACRLRSTVASTLIHTRAGNP